MGRVREKLNLLVTRAAQRIIDREIVMPTETVLEAQMAAPEFCALATDGKEIALKDYLGKKRVILYFYPKDDTPGCTVEACQLRDQRAAIEDESAVVLGVSPDSVASHQKFTEKFKLPFLLLADEDKKICRAYGVWAKKKLYGKEYMGVERTTFVIGKDGKIEKVYRKVKPDGHAQEILEFLKQN